MIGGSLRESSVLSAPVITTGAGGLVEIDIRGGLVLVPGELAADGRAPERESGEALGRSRFWPEYTFHAWNWQRSPRPADQPVPTLQLAGFVSKRFPGRSRPQETQPST